VVVEVMVLELASKAAMIRCEWACRYDFPKPLRTQYHAGPSLYAGV
jgi:hypothetical protein